MQEKVNQITGSHFILRLFPTRLALIPGATLSEYALANNKHVERKYTIHFETDGAE